MIYTKVKSPDGKTLRCRVTGDNTYTECSVCGKEIKLGLNDSLISQLKSLNPTVICSTCTERMLRHSDITLGALSQLIAALRQMGYHREFIDTCKEYDIIGLGDLDHDEYDSFMDDFLEKVCRVRRINHG